MGLRDASASKKFPSSRLCRSIALKAGYPWIELALDQVDRAPEDGAEGRSSGRDGRNALGIGLHLVHLQMKT